MADILPIDSVHFFPHKSRGFLKQAASAEYFTGTSPA
jgi:hypothetical protein